MLYYASEIKLTGKNIDGFHALVDQVKVLGGKVALQLSSRNESDFLVTPICIALLNLADFNNMLKSNIAVTESCRWQKVNKDKYLTYDQIEWDDDSDWSTIVFGIADINDEVYRRKFEPEPPKIETLGLSDYTLSMFQSYGYIYVNDIVHKLRQKQTGNDGRPVGKGNILIVLNEDETAYQELIQKLNQHGYHID